MPKEMRPLPPILSNKHFEARSVFTPESILREARRQKGLHSASVPAICVLDPDGDIVRYLKRAGRGHKDRQWACYHTELHRTQEEELELGIVPHAVGASFAVLIAEQLFASGCKLLISVTSSGQLVELHQPPYFVLIDKALRDEGTSYHYLPPADFSLASTQLLGRLSGAFRYLAFPVAVGAAWTTDAPFRETAEAVEIMKAMGLLAVEMEAAALYAFAAARKQPVICFAHVTNQMARIEGDFEKGEADGAIDALRVITEAARACLP
jgi:uridine phosphorylase